MRLVNNEYVIELDDILNNSEITEDEVIATFGEEYKSELARLSRKVYRAIDLGYKRTDIPNHHLIARQLIIKDTSRQQGFMYAVIEYVRMALINGGDMQEYETGVYKIPDVVLDELIRYDCWFPYEFTFDIGELDA
jgi:hypothetical protein